MGLHHAATSTGTVLALVAVATLAACGGAADQTLQRPPTTTRPVPTATSSAVTTTTAPPPSSTTTSSSSIPIADLPKVIANCTAPAPQSQVTQFEPSSISLACADDGTGVEDMSWTTWTATVATGDGRLWENTCTPNCANGAIETYAATITLSDVQSTSAGDLFSRLAAVYQGTGPNGHATDQFVLPLPPE